jgi:hypothetical protein
MIRPAFRALLAAGLLALVMTAGCSVTDFLLRHTSNITEAPDVEEVKLPPEFKLKVPAGAAVSADEWVLASSTVVGPVPNGDETSVFDLSTFLARDPWVGIWSSPLPSEQKVFVKASDLYRVKLEAGDWRERYVIQLAENDSLEARRGTEENGRLAFNDIARVLCPAGVSRRLLSSNPIEATYESHFARCSRFGPDRVVLTRELFGNYDMMRHSQAVYSFSYEVRGASFTPGQRTAGLKLIEAPTLMMATWDGAKHPLMRDARLHLVTSQ